MLSRIRLFALAGLFALAALLVLPSQRFATAQNSSLKDPATLKPLKYRLLGPAWGGRITRVAGVPGEKTYYTATASGGVWKSVDDGISWRPIFDDQAISSVGSLAVAPSDPNVLYVGTGEANIRGDVAAGNGIYKSIDAGKSWRHVWKQEGQIGTMVVHPTNPDIAFAAVLGHAFGPNRERGVYRTQDAGRTWQQVLSKDERTGASDVALDPSNPSVVFAGLWEAQRYPWDLKSGGPGSGLYVSRDGGDTWKELKGNGLPAHDGKNLWGKVGVAVAPSNGRRVYALIEAEKGGLFASDDGGEKWSLVTADRRIRQRPWYYMTITVHPTNENELWFPSVGMYRSIDGGKTLLPVSGIHHGDHHDVWFDPKQPRRMITGNDGGVDVSSDGGQTWYAPALPLGQFYHVSTDTRVPFHVAGAMQDIGTAQGPSNSLNVRGIRNTDWYSVGGGEAGWVESDPSDPNIVYAGEYGGVFTRYDHRTRQARNVSIFPEDPSGHGASDFRHRFQWTAPIHVSPHNPKVVYHGGEVLFKTSDGGQTWAAISPDLSRNDKTKQQWAGGPITGDNTGVEVYSTIFCVAESPVQKDLLWAGTDDGLVHLTRDGGKTWKNLTAGLTGLPAFATVSIIEASRFDAATAYVVVDNHRQDDNRPYLYKTSDFGATWQRLDGSLPQDIYLHAVREDPTDRNLLYLGTERGVAFSLDGGRTWQSLKLNLPTVAVHDLAIKENTLVVATHGRSLWAFDHLSVIRTMNSLAGNAKLLAAPDVIRWRYANVPADKFAGQNPPKGATIYYFLPEAPPGEVTVEILDASNNLVAQLSSQPRPPVGFSDNLAKEAKDFSDEALPKAAGVNAAVWDLRYDGAELIDNGRFDLGGPVAGPMVAPGAYTVRLTVNGQTQTTKLNVLPDPRVQLTEADYKAQRDLAVAIRDDTTRLTRFVRGIRSVRGQLQARNELLKTDARAAQLIGESQSLMQKLDALEGRLHNANAEVVYDILAFKGGAQLYSRIGFLHEVVADADGPPSQGTREVYADQKRELDGHEAELKRLLGELATLNATAKRLDFPHILAPELSSLKTALGTR